MELLAILACWTPADGPSGLTLELSANSPSDTTHGFCDFRLEDDYPFTDEENFPDEQTVIEFHQRKVDELVPGPGPGPPEHPEFSLGTLYRVSGTHLEFQSPKSFTLPRVPIVKGFMMRAHYIRTLSADAIAKLFQESFVSATWLGLERMRPPDFEEEFLFHKGVGYFTLLRDFLCC